MNHPSSRRGPAIFAFGALLSGLLAAPSARALPAAGPDPRAAILRRMDRYFQRHEVDGVVLDARYVLNETEAVRLSVIPQLLGYAELERRRPSARLRRDIAERADYLVDRLELVRSGSVFDGMLAYSLLEAYDVTGDPGHLAAAESILDELDALPTSERILNGGLMAAMAFARDYHRTGDARRAQEVSDILTVLAPYQHTDGSFPHWCPCSTDVHYTDWMAQELILIGRLVNDPRIEPMLARMHAFLDARVGDDGVTRYQAPCWWDPSECTVAYWSVGSGCNIDYDTRGFTNELGYSALEFAHAGSPKYRAVLQFLDGLEDGGVIADKWDYPIPQSDPYWPWTSADTSVVNMSLVFWSLAAIPGSNAHAPGAFAEEDAAAIASPRPPGRSGLLVDRWPRFAAVTSGLYCDEPELRSSAAPQSRIEIETATAGGEVTIRFVLPVAGSVSCEIRDVRGRLVLSLPRQEFDAGPQALPWDGCDARGRACARGIYFARIAALGATRSARILYLPRR